MGRQTEKSRYLSKYSPEENYVSPSQYITELICEHKAQFDGRGLPFRFWQHPDWEKFYRQQIPAANALLKKYDERDIIASLRDKRTARTYSLRGPWLVGIIKQKQKEREAKPKVVQVEHKEQELTKPQKQHGEKSIISKLRRSNG